MHSKFAIPTLFPSLLSISPSHLHFRDHGVCQGPAESVSPIAALLNHSTIRQPAHVRVLGAALPPLGAHHSLPPVANTLHRAHNRTSCWQLYCCDTVQFTVDNHSRSSCSYPQQQPVCVHRQLSSSPFKRAPSPGLLVLFRDEEHVLLENSCCFVPIT